ncbi:PAS domain S-box protein [Paludisphaera rhizosphaerae]|uniref:PAS domain S-box protein n=1 Tax=Paludisphaera rhizosphaerae TaxID=2711216 RepID=UPI001980E108|nr:PAS domain S-box protein [Paludisphaera rhizosphaerae]
MDGRWDRNKTAGVAALGLLVVVNAAISYRNARAIRSDSEEVVHTEQVLADVAALRADLRGMEAAQRRFLLLGDDSSQAEFLRTAGRVDAGVDELARLTLDNTEQKPRITALHDAVRRTYTKLSEAVRIRRELGPEAARANVAGGGAHAALDDSERRLDDVGAAERTLLTKRRTETDKAYDDAVLFGAASTVFGLAAVAGFAWLLARDAAIRRRAEEVRARLAAIVESSADAIVGMTPEGIVQTWNAGAEALFDRSAEEAVGRPIDELIVPPELREESRGVLRRVARDEPVEPFETVRMSRGGRKIEVSATVSPIRDPAGRVVGASKVLRDVGARKRAERQAREGEARFRTLFEQGVQFAGVLSADGEILEANRSCFDSWGLQREDVLGRPFWECPWWASSPTLARTIRDACERAASGETLRFEEPYLVVDGTERVMDLAITPVVDEVGRILFLSSTATDVTDRKRGEESLRRSEERYRTLFNSIDQGFCVAQVVFDGDRPVDYRFMEANPVFETQTGLVDVVGRSARELVPDLEDHWFAIYGEVARTGVPTRFLERAEAMGRWFDVYAFRVGAPDEAMVAILFTDVTERKRAEEERERLLRHASEERERLAEAFERSPAFVAVLRGPEHVYERVNARYEELIGRRDLVGRTVREVVPEVGEQGYFEVLDRVFRESEAYIATGRRVQLARGPAGEIEDRWLDFVFQPLIGPDGGVSGVLIHGIDLSDRFRAEAEAREKDQRLQLLLGNATDYAVLITDPEGIVVDWAGGAEAITGYAPADVLGRPADVIFTPDDRAAGVPAREMATAAREGRAEDKRWHLRKDGSTFFAEGVMVPLREEGLLRGFGKLFRDATARRRSEEGVRFLADAGASIAELVDYESTLQRIARLAVGGFADWCAVDLVEEDGRLRRLALNRSTAVEESAESGVEKELDGLVSHVMATGEPEVVYDLAGIDPGSTVVGDDRLAAVGIRSCLGVPILSRGRVAGCLTFLSASGRRRFGPEQLRVAQDLAERVAVAVENGRLYRALQEADRRKAEFLATLAHELRNPLAPVRNGVQVLRLGGDDPAARARAVEMMDRQIVHLVRLVDDLMDVSRVNSGKVALRLAPVDLREIVEAAVEISRQMIDSGGHELGVRVADEPLPLEADRTRLVQVLANLLNNAAKYTPHGGRIELSAGREGMDAVVCVTDSGVGISAEMLPRIFDMFTQIGTTIDRSQGGLGIGLTLVRRLVEMHGGTVSARSEGAGQGSTLIVRLPLARPATVDEGSVAAAPAVPASSRLNVLVVDDNRDSAESLAILLGLKGHEVRTAHDGPEALRTLESFRPHLVLLDLGLPGMSGFEVARRIRSSAGLRGVQLAALTGWGQEEDRRRTREAGFDHHLVKPADPEAVEAVLATLLHAAG